MTYIPVSEPAPPDDQHVWAAPASPPCPDCECCTEALCHRAALRGSACHLEARGDEELVSCPCWREATKVVGRRVCELVEAGMTSRDAHTLAMWELVEALVARLRDERDRLAREIEIKREADQEGGRK